MSTLVVYDSVFGNTGKVAEAIAAELAETQQVRTLSVGEAGPDDLAGVSLLVVGSPTRGFRPLPAVQEFLAALPDSALRSLNAAAFDTRIDLETVHPAPLRWIVDCGGYAADVMHHKLIERHCREAAGPIGFLVTGAEGPLKEGELDRAREWARSIATAAAPTTQ